MAAAALVALPASAMASGESLTVTPANFQAGGGTNVTETFTFAAGQNPKTEVTSLAPGLLGNLNANPSCLASEQLTASCQIGTATAHLDQPAPNGTDVPSTMYLVPPEGTDAAGIEFVAPAAFGVPNQYSGVTLNPNAPGGLNVTTTFNALPSGVNLASVTANFTTLNGQEFSRLPSSCAVATSTFSVTYDSGATGSASGSFTPTGCSGLPYSPNLTAAVTASKSGAATLTLGVTQAADESANSKIVLSLGGSITPNATADIPCLSGTACKIGTATATSPLVPSAALAGGTITLGGSATTPTITISWPAPFPIAITGDVDLATNSVTFSPIPDVPLTSLVLNVTGPNGQSAFTTDCAPASVVGDFTAQGGQTNTSTAPITYTNCSQKPTLTGSTSGLAKGHPKLTFKVVHGKGGANVASVAIGLPGGLRFSRSAISTHKTCTTGKNKKKKCTTTTLIKGLGIKGGAAKTVALKGGKLVITLKKAAGTVTFTISGPLVSETKALQTNVKKHKTKKLSFSLKVTDATHTSTTQSLKLNAH